MGNVYRSLGTLLVRRAVTDIRSLSLSFLPCLLTHCEAIPFRHYRFFFFFFFFLIFTGLLFHVSARPDFSQSPSNWGRRNKKEAPLALSPNEWFDYCQPIFWENSYWYALKEGILPLSFFCLSATFSQHFFVLLWQGDVCQRRNCCNMLESVGVCQERERKKEKLFRMKLRIIERTWESNA